MSTNAYINRFRDRVAISLPDGGETIYLTEEEARAIAVAMLTVATNIENCPKFSESNFGTIAVEISDPNN